MADPVPITAALNYSKEQAEALRAAASVSAKQARPLLQQFHDELMAALAPRLSALRGDGLLVDHASSWLLGQFVAHAPADRVAEAIEQLSRCSQLRGVERAAPRGRPQRQRPAGRRR